MPDFEIIFMVSWLSNQSNLWWYIHDLWIVNNHELSLKDLPHSVFSRFIPFWWPRCIMSSGMDLQIKHLYVKNIFIESHYTETASWFESNIAPNSIITNWKNSFASNFFISGSYPFEPLFWGIILTPSCPNRDLSWWTAVKIVVKWWLNWNRLDIK